MWWNQDGIYTLIPDQLNTTYSVASVTEETTKSFYQNLGDETSKKYAQGAYNNLDKLVQWVFKSASTPTFSEHFEYDKVLTFNIKTQAFYPDTIVSGSSDPHVSAIFTTEGEITQTTTSDVTDSSVAVTDGGIQVTVSVDTNIPTNSLFKYYTENSARTQSTFSEFKDTEHRDWALGVNNAGASFTSYFLTGYILRGEGLRRFRTPYIGIISKYSSDYGAFVQPRWDYALNTNTSRWGSNQQVYATQHTESDYSYSQRKLRLKGRGRTLQLYFSNDGDKQFEISGWTQFNTAEGAA
jgi:hypothetical protein